MSSIARTPPPPYYAVIFTSIRTEGDRGYAEMAARMVELAARQPGFLGVESAREELGVTVSYWRDLESIKQWKAQAGGSSGMPPSRPASPGSSATMSKSNATMSKSNTTMDKSHVIMPIRFAGGNVAGVYLAPRGMG